MGGDYFSSISLSVPTLLTCIVVSIFVRQGVPDILKSDNGPPFNGHEFEDFPNYIGLKHGRITSFWPRANGEVERVVQTLEKKHQDCSYRKEELETRVIQISVPISRNSSFHNKCLCCEALNNRKLKTLLPEPPTT